jgi:hypothetical protein
MSLQRVIENAYVQSRPLKESVDAESSKHYVLSESAGLR